jgi:ferredoxin
MSQLLVSIDRSRCLGAALCCFHAPATFDVDEDDMRVVLLDGRDDDAAIRNAAEACPNNVISMTERG